MDRASEMMLINGTPADTIPATDRGFAYGDGVFRTFIARDGQAKNWRRHYDKLEADCAALGIVCPDTTLLHDEVVAVSKSHARAVVKITVTRGSGPRGYAPPHAAQPLRVVSAEAASALAIPAGMEVHLCQTRYARQPALAGVKHLNRLENVLARREWSDAHVREGLMLDTSGLVIGGTMSNVFIVEEAGLVTPALDQCGVAGVTRARVLALMPVLRFACAIDEITLPRLLAAREVFFVSSVIGLWRVARLGATAWESRDVSSRVAAAQEAADE